MNVLITHECTGAVSSEFRKLGHVAWSCDLKPSAHGPQFHIQRDALAAIRGGSPSGGPWHHIGMHPDCTFLTVAGIHWNNRGRGWEKTNAALQHVKDCMAAATLAGARWSLENPVSIISSHIRKPDQIIQPYQFGEDASKSTCLWLQGLRILRALPSEQWIAPRWVCGQCKAVSTDEQAKCWIGPKGFPLCHRCESTPRLLPRWANQTDSGQNKLGPSPTRAADRAATYPGIAKAMAAQWGKLQPSLA